MVLQRPVYRIERECLSALVASGPKRTYANALHMSASGGKADITIAACPLLRSLLDVKQTWAFALRMSAYDPKRTWAVP
jgi:hypothetical protein